MIDFEEFSDMLDKTKSIADPEADLKEAFRVFDLDGDGVITVSPGRFDLSSFHSVRTNFFLIIHLKFQAKELKLVMHSLGQPVSQPDIEEMMKEADINCEYMI